MSLRPDVVYGFVVCSICLNKIHYPIDVTPGEQRSRVGCHLHQQHSLRGREKSVRLDDIMEAHRQQQLCCDDTESKPKPLTWQVVAGLILFVAGAFIFIFTTGTMGLPRNLNGGGRLRDNSDTPMIISPIDSTYIRNALSK